MEVGREVWEDLGGSGGGETIIRLDYKGKSIFNKNIEK